MMQSELDKLYEKVDSRRSCLQMVSYCVSYLCERNLWELAEPPDA